MKKLLKTCLLGLCAFFGIASFCNADTIGSKINRLVNNQNVSFRLDAGNNQTQKSYTIYELNSSDDYGTYCIKFNDIDLTWSTNSSSLAFGFANSQCTTNNGGCSASNTLPNNRYSIYSDQTDKIICIYGNKLYLNVVNRLVMASSTSTPTISGTINYSIFKLDDFLTTNIPTYSLFVADLSSGFNEYTINEDINLTYDSSDIDLYRLSDFSFEFGVNSNNRISKSSVNQNYCTSNNLCPSCPTCNNYTIKLYDFSDEENPTLEYSGTVENNRNIYYSGVNVEQGLLGNTKSFMFYGENNSCSSCPSCPSCPNQYTSLECQSEYSLIPISSVNQSYCESNNLCPVCTPATGDLIFSNVYINDILHPGRPSVFVNIPDYIFWDYSVNDSEFNIYVGSGYDVDYIDSIVSINSYRPSSEDFTNVFVGGLTLIMPYVVIILFVVFIRKFIKRIFK